MVEQVLFELEQMMDLLDCLRLIAAVSFFE
jgi:hypothetical protein